MVNPPEAKLYNNRSLFSDYYLRELVRDDPHWRHVLAGVPALRQKIGDIYKRGAPGIEQVSEAEVERRLIRPVLNALGHVYQVQPDVRSPEGTKTPDYGFFMTAEDRNRAAAAGIDEYWKHALAVGDAKAWDRSLDRRLKGPGDPFTNHNPSYQIDFYLRATDLKWGILTNGRLWRLYYRDLSYRLDVYYEVNLPELLERTDEEFNYFAAFFSQRAFTPDEQGGRFLDRAYKGSLDYATGLSKELKDNVYEALRLLTEGFLRFPGNGLALEELDRIRENAFVVIYRLLFILYAEDRGFLPLENRDYADTYSLRALAKEIAQKIDGRAGLSPAASGYWSRLQDLFRMIDAGDIALGIPPYNGGLFDESRHPELGQWKIGDSYLAQAVDMLARAKAAERTGRGFVSYRELSIRELGSIYEGLLEHRPRIAEESMVVVRDDKRERVIPERQAQGKRALDNYQPGEVYLTLHRGERKATGSYYTPDYIVKYIVANTLGPLIEDRKESGADLAEAILSMNVLDPAMGSGHFLVEATDFLARALVEALSGEAGELEEDDIRWARREVVERCIHGVDLNPLAVELTKLSLWLHTVSRDEPLNFLDHHLRCGNSLIGAWLRDLGQLPAAKGAKKKAKSPTAMTTLEGHGLQEAIAAAVKTFHAIAEAPTHTVEDVHTKENAYQTARHALSRIIDIADSWTSAYFGNDVGPEAYARLLLEAYRGDGDWPGAGEIAWLDKARGMGREERRFFHWELEFPEVFFDHEGQRLENSGFDVVVGNPPWGGDLDSKEKEFIFGEFIYARGKTDSYIYFLERGFSILTDRGWLGEIVPSTVFRGDNSKMIRESFLGLGTWSVAIQLGEGVFGDVNFDSAITVVRQNPPEDDSVVRCKVVSAEETFDAVPEAGVPLSLFRSLGLVIPSLTAQAAELVEHLNEYAIHLGDISTIRQGIITGDNARFLAKERLSPQHRPFIKGELVQRYCITDDPEWIRYDRDALLAPREAAIWEAPEKIITQGIRNVYLPDKLLAVYDAARLCSSQNTNVIFRIVAPYHIKFVLSLVNSSLLNWYYRLLFTMTDIRCEFQRLLPIRRISFTTVEAERERLMTEATDLWQRSLVSGDFAPLLRFVNARLPKSPEGSPDVGREQSGVVHDLLGFLAEQMTRLHKDKQEEAKGFLAWLEGYLGSSVDDLQNKTKVSGYHGLEGGWDEFAAVLDQNRGAIQQAKGIDVTRREPREAIRQEYEASMARLRPLLRKIELTDRLIDLIVYRLYGLTDEEIAIVEGRA